MSIPYKKTLNFWWNFVTIDSIIESKPGFIIICKKILNFWQTCLSDGVHQFILTMASFIQPPLNIYESSICNTLDCDPDNINYFCSRTKYWLDLSEVCFKYPFHKLTNKLKYYYYLCLEIYNMCLRSEKEDYLHFFVGSSSWAMHDISSRVFQTRIFWVQAMSTHL